MIHDSRLVEEGIAEAEGREVLHEKEELELEDDNSTEVDRLCKSNIEDEQTYEVSTWRWWVLFCFGMGAVVQALCWNALSPIDDCLRAAYGDDTFSDNFIEFAVNTSNVSFLLALYPAAWFVEQYGPRIVTISCAGLLMTSAYVRCIPLEIGSLQGVMTVSMVFNGLAGGWFTFGGPIISELWFPAEQRTMATAFGTVAPNFGSAMAFVIGPAIVGSDKSGGHHPDCGSEHVVRRLFLVELGLSVAVFLSCVAYFPDHPAHAPSQAAAQKRVSRRRSESLTKPLVGVVGLLTCSGANRLLLRKFWLVALCLGLPLGLFPGWVAVLYLNLYGFMSEDEAGSLGLWMVTTGCLGSIIVGAFVDRMTGNLKTVAAILLALSSLGLAVFLGCISGAFSASHSYNLSLAYASGIWGGFFFNSSIPLFFEMAMEIVFGWCSQTTTSAFLVFVATSAQIIFLAIPTQINGSSRWMNWTLVFVFVGCTVGTMILRMHYARSSFDAKSKGGDELRIAKTKWSQPGELDQIDGLPTVATRCDNMGLI